MKAFFALLLTTWFFSLYLPWWSIVLPAILIGAWLCPGVLNGFATGFIASGLAWIGQAGITSFRNGGVLIERVGELLSGSPSWVVFLLIGLIAGLLGGTGASLGVQIREKLHPTFISR